jgi:hypothetical protein
VGGLLFLVFVLVGYGGPAVLLVFLVRHRMLSVAGVVAGLAALVIVTVWAWHDISTSESSTAALGFLVLPVLLFAVAGATVLVDRLAFLGGWLLRRRHAPAPERRPRRDPDDWSGLP